ncbi:MAG: hypothetical protein HZB25_12195 [Candidatus Eisenbacteria bacterium]|nr:hypothetical protein [Candidatus Eisenbacteria bacterium]
MAAPVPSGSAASPLLARRVICAAMTAATLLYTVLGWFVIARARVVPEGAIPPVIQYALMGAALGMLLAGSWLSLRATDVPAESPPGGDPVSPVALDSLRRGLIALVVLEGSALVFTVTAVVSGRLEMLAGPLVCAGLMLRMWPRESGS